MTIRVLIADDHAMVRQGLAALLGAQGGFEIAGEAANGREAVHLAKKLPPGARRAPARALGSLNAGPGPPCPHFQGFPDTAARAPQLPWRP